MAKRKQSQRDMIIEWLNIGSFCAYQLSALTGVSIASVHKRLNDMYNDGEVEQTGETITCGNNETYAIYRKVAHSDREKVRKKRDNQRNLDNLRVRFNNGWITKERYESDLYDLTEEMNKQ